MPTFFSKMDVVIYVYIYVVIIIFLSRPFFKAVLFSNRQGIETANRASNRASGLSSEEAFAISCSTLF